MREWKQAVTIIAQVKKAQQQEGASIPACWETHVWGEAATAGGSHAAAVVC